MKISEAIKFIVDKNDKKLLTDSKRFKAYLLDLCSDNPKELKIINRCLDDNILKKIFGNERDNVKIARLRDEFDDQGMSEDWRDFIINSFAEALSWNYTIKQTTQQIQQAIQSKKDNNKLVRKKAQSQQVQKQQTQNKQVQQHQSSNQTDWTCSCGTVNNGNFCGNCGKSKSILKNIDWTCSCGTVNKTKFCRNCGKTEQQVEEARRKVEEEARKRAEEETRRKVEEETRRKVEEEARRKVEEEARRRAEEEVRRNAEEEVRRNAEEEAKRNAEEEARKRAEEETRRKAEEEARRKNAQVGDYIKFGSYPQSANGDIKPIEWLVLSKKNNKMLVISKYGLEARRFDSNSNNWKNSEIRKWLNGEFYNKAFNGKEKKLIRATSISTTVYEKKKKSGLFGNLLGLEETVELNELTNDYVFLLSKEEAEKYFVNDYARMCKSIEYAKANASCTCNGYGYWWLRSSFPNSNYVYFVNFDGNIYDIVCYDSSVVRPALWINF